MHLMTKPDLHQCSGGSLRLSGSDRAPPTCPSFEALSCPAGRCTPRRRCPRCTSKILGHGSWTPSAPFCVLRADWRDPLFNWRWSHRCVRDLEGPALLGGPWGGQALQRCGDMVSLRRAPQVVEASAVGDPPTASAQRERGQPPSQQRSQAATAAARPSHQEGCWNHPCTMCNRAFAMYQQGGTCDARGAGRKGGSLLARRDGRRHPTRHPSQHGNANWREPQGGSKQRKPRWRGEEVRPPAWPDHQDRHC